MIDDGHDRSELARTFCIRMLALCSVATVGAIIAFTGLGLMVGLPPIAGLLVRRTFSENRRGKYSYRGAVVG